MEKNRERRGNCVSAAAVLLLLIFLLCGCRYRSAGSENLTQDGGAAGESAEAFETVKAAETTAPETKEATSGKSDDETFDDVTPSGEPLVQQKIVVATDLHYLAESLSGNRCRSFLEVSDSGDGLVLQYGWEILDAFIEDVLREKPDIVVLTGDLTLNGEKKSHEELAKKLSILLDNQIQVAVIPGNHDINNPAAKAFTEDGSVKTETVTPQEFAEIYADFGYVAADDRDPASLSYLYKLDDYYSLLMLDTCQYAPANQIGGMIHRETYQWMEEHFSDIWEEGGQVITVTHHNLLEQSGVSRDFYDNCTIEHNEQLLRLLSDWEVRLHLSGHLHLQHHMQDSDSGIYEVVTGSLVMSPCRYGVLRIMESGTYEYEAKAVDVDGWAKRRKFKNQDLADFTNYCKAFLQKLSYRNAVEDLRKHTLERKLFLSDERIDRMARFYAELCVYYYEGRVFEIWDTLKESDEFRYWNDVDYVSELSDFLRNILNDEAKDFSHLEIPY